MAKAANFLPAEQRMTAEMTDESVCPDGKEKSVGFLSAMIYPRSSRALVGQQDF